MNTLQNLMSGKANVVSRLRGQLRTTLHVMMLETRDMLAGNNPWPVPSPVGGREIAQVYGQFYR